MQYYICRNLTGFKNDFKSCLLLNISQCHISETYQQFTVTMYNPLSRPVDTYVRLPVRSGSYAVENEEGLSVINQMVNNSQRIAGIPGRSSLTSHELVFQASNVPPLGYKTYSVSRKGKPGRSLQSVVSKKEFVGTNVSSNTRMYERSQKLLRGSTF